MRVGVPLAPPRKTMRLDQTIRLIEPRAPFIPHSEFFALPGRPLVVQSKVVFLRFENLAREDRIMAAITKQEAVDRLTRAVATASPDDLVEIYNELFPEEPTTENEATENPSPLVEKILAHIDSGL